MPPNPKINLKDKVEDGEMDLSMCDLQEVPVKEIITCKKVYSIDLSNNHLVQLPKTFPTLTNITKLDLSKNKLKSLPENFGNLKRLKHLDLYKNDLQHLPVSFSELKTLKWLDLKDNPLVPVLKEAAGQCLDNKQCQICATNVVYFFAQLKEKIEQERQVRENQRQKDRLANELAAQKAKQQEKKNKKREKAKQEEKNSTVYSEQLPEILETEVTANLQRKSKDSLGLFPVLFVLMSFVCMLLFILTSVKFEQTRFIEENVIKCWTICLDNAPPMIQDIGNITGSFIGNMHEKVGRHIFELQIPDNVIHYIDKVKGYYNFVLQYNK